MDGKSIALQSIGGKREWFTIIIDLIVIMIIYMIEITIMNHDHIKVKVHSLNSRWILCVSGKAGYNQLDVSVEGWGPPHQLCLIIFIISKNGPCPGPELNWRSGGDESSEAEQELQPAGSPLRRAWHRGRAGSQSFDQVCTYSFQLSPKLPRCLCVVCISSLNLPKPVRFAYFDEIWALSCGKIS